MIEMGLYIKPPKNTEVSVYKTLYIRASLVECIHKMAKEYNTSFNNIVISMIEQCLNEARSAEREAEAIE